MKAFHLITAISLFLSGTSACWATLGETEAQCITRYGPEFDVSDSVGYRKVGDTAASFHHKTAAGSLDIRIVFLNGASCHETYTNTDSSHGLSMDQMKGILEAQRAGFEWRKGQTVYRTANIGGDTYGSIEWLRSDGATAKFWISGKADSQTATGQVEISTRQYTEAQRIFDKENGDG